MSPTATAVLAVIRDEPGDWTVEDIAEITRTHVIDVRRAVYRMRRQGLVAPRAYRLHAHVIDRYGSDAATIVPWWVRADVQRQMIGLVDALIQHGPLSGDSLARSVGAERLSGAHKRALRVLADAGIVSPPSCLWPVASPSPSGEE